jgi:cysteine synthase A
MIYRSVLDLVGHTPILQLGKINRNIFVKCEFLNPNSSIKDRIAKGMIRNALKDGVIDKNTHLIEATSGNTGIALASICSSLGLKLTIIMPESMSIERRKLIQYLGAELILTSNEDGMQGSIDKAQELHSQIENSYIINQFENIYNIKSHTQTANEILLDMQGINIDTFISVIGTGGTITGVGKVLKKYNRKLSIVAIEPSKSEVLQGKEHSKHKIEGIGAGFIPKILDQKIYSEIVSVDDEEAIRYSQLLAKEEGLLVGISSGANIAGAMKISQKYPHKKILTILCDSADRYISTDLFK